MTYNFVERASLNPRDGTTAPAAPNVFGKYTLLDRIGMGGMAEVWTARVTGPAGFQRTVVVKRTLQHLNRDPQFAAMFLAEARLSARLNHPNIVQVYELGEVGGEYFLAMEHVSGRDLATILRQLDRVGRRPPPAFAALVVRDIARALSYAHRLRDDAGQPLRIIHRDVTPSNIMVSFDGGIKLVDFGIAKALASAEERTQTGTLKGKFSYMAPEQIEGEAIDHRADLFALGVVLHEMLTMRRLFKGAHDLETIAKVRRTEVPPPSQANAEVTPELDAICLKALARDRDARYQSGDELAIALDAIVHREGFSPERVRELMRELFGDEPARAAAAPASPVSASTRLARPATPVVAITRMAAAGRARKIVGALALLAAIAAAAAVLTRQRAQRHSPPRAVATASASATPPPSINPAATAPANPGATAPTNPAATAASAAATAPTHAAAPSATPPVAIAPQSGATTTRAATPARVHVDFQSRPSHALVFLDDERRPRGRTPLALELAPSPARHRVRFVLDGHRPEELGFVADRDVRLETALVPAPARTHRAATSARPPTGAHPPAPGDDVPDPFR
jgi:serine/threonine-protein kinase